MGGENFPILKVPYCLYGKGCCREGKALGSEEVKCREMDFVMNRGETLKGVFTAGDRNFGVSVRKTKLLYFFYLITMVLALGGLHVKNAGYQSAFHTALRASHAALPMLSRRRGV